MLLDATQPDLVLNMGVHGRIKHWAAEKSAPRVSRVGPDIDSSVLSLSTLETIYPSTEIPDRVETTLPYEDMIRRWKEIMGDEVDVRESDDIGAFLCGFQYLTSQIWFRRQNGIKGVEKSTGGPVIFLHVPPCGTVAELEKGRDIVVGLVKAMVESWLEGKRVQTS